MFLIQHNQLFSGKLMTLKGIISLLINPGNTLSVYDIEDGLRNGKASQLSFNFIKSQPGVKEIIQERYLATLPSLETLARYPENSLGYCLAAYLKKFNFTPDFYRSLEVKDDLSYLYLRRRQTHDIWHIITGFGTDPASELGLKAFELAQTRSPMSVIILAGGLLRTILKTPEQLVEVLDRIAVGYRMGVNAKSFLAQKWEDRWQKPVAQWRKELGVEVI